MGNFTFTSPEGKKYTVRGPEGATQEQAWEILQEQLAHPPHPGFDALDTVKSIGTGLVKGAIGLAGMPGDIGRLVDMGLEKLSGPKKAIPEEEQSALYKLRQATSPPTSADIQGGIEKVTGEFHKPESTAGDYAQTIAEFAPGLVGGGSLVRKGVGVVSSGAASEAAGQATKGTALEPYARIAGAFTGPGLAKVAQVAAAPITSQIAARVNPAGYAEKQFARHVSESQLPPNQVANDVLTAAREGQPHYAVADALGSAGQEALSTVARSPGIGRTETTNFLNDRQLGQGRRVQNAIAEGFNAPQTAEEAREALTAHRTATSDANYGSVRGNGAPVDVSRVIDRIDRTLNPGISPVARPQSGIANDPIESALQRLRSQLTDGRSHLTDFDALSRVRSQLSDDIQASVQAGRGNQARLMGQALRDLDAAMEHASPGFRAANAEHAQMSRNIEAVGEGQTAAQRGRSEDVVRTFAGRPPENQQPYRVGYADRLIQNAQGAGPGVNRARFVAPADELAALAAPGQYPLMERRLARENTMFDTRHRATGGSMTSSNLANDAALGLLPEIVGAGMNAAHGNWGGLLRQGLHAGTNALTGNTPAVRAELGRILMMNGGNSSPTDLARILSRAGVNVANRQASNRAVYLRTPALELSHLGN